MEHVNIPGIMSPTNLCVATDESPFPQGSSDRRLANLAEVLGC